jgi:hypothetical protein
MEAFWTIPLFILPLLTILLVVKGAGEYKTDKKTKRLKLSLLVLAITVLYYLLVFSTTADSTKYYEQKIIGQFRMTKSSEVILNIWPHHAFTLDNKIDNKFYGDGNWEISLNDYVLLKLDFENGETLTLKYLPQDSVLIGDNELTDKIKFQKSGSNN